MSSGASPLRLVSLGDRRDHHFRPRHDRHRGSAIPYQQRIVRCVDRPSLSRPTGWSASSNSPRIGLEPCFRSNLRNSCRGSRLGVAAARMDPNIHRNFRLPAVVAAAVGRHLPSTSRYLVLLDAPADAPSLVV